MAGKAVSFLIGAFIVYFAVKILLKTFKDAKSGKCSGCGSDCTACESGADKRNDDNA